MKKIFTLCIAACLCFSNSYGFDSKTNRASSTKSIFEEPIKGKVKGSAGELIPGVTILVKRTGKGTATDASGSFTVNANQGDVLVVTFVGYIKQEVKVAGNNLSITLAEDSAQLDEIVVIGSRSNTARTDVDRPVPVDIITAKEMRSTGQVEIGQQLQYSSPSFYSSKNGINGIAGYADQYFSFLWQ